MTDNQIEPVLGNVPNISGTSPVGTESPPFSVGAALREARTHLSLSVAEISDRIKFAPRQIEALEADDFSHLPEAAFVRGFVRSYARALQLDPAPLLAALPHSQQQTISLEAKVLADVPFTAEQGGRKPNLLWVGGALVLAVILGLSVWLSSRAPDTQQDATLEPVALEPLPVEQEAPLAQVPVGASQVAASAVPLAAATPIASVRFVFDKQAWIEVADKDGKILLSQAGKGGTEKTLESVPPLLVSIGYASGVKLYYKGNQVDLKPYTKLELARLTLE